MNDLERANITLDFLNKYYGEYKDLPLKTIIAKIKKLKAKSFEEHIFNSNEAEVTKYLINLYSDTEDFTGEFIKESQYIGKSITEYTYYNDDDTERLVDVDVYWFKQEILTKEDYYTIYFYIYGERDEIFEDVMGNGDIYVFNDSIPVNRDIPNVLKKYYRDSGLHFVFMRDNNKTEDIWFEILQKKLVDLIKR